MEEERHHHPCRSGVDLARRQRNTECHPSLTAARVSHPLPTPICCSTIAWTAFPFPPGRPDRSACAVPLPSGAIKVASGPSLRRDPAPSSHRAPPPLLRGRNTDDPRGIDTLTRLSRHTVVVLPGCIKRAAAPAARQARHRPNPLLLSVHWRPPGAREVPFIGTSIQSVNGGLVVSASQRPTTKTTDSFRGGRRD